MKNLRKVYKINWFWFAIACFSYFALFLSGQLAERIGIEMFYIMLWLVIIIHSTLGIFQIVTACCLVYNRKYLSKRLKTRIYIYLGLSILMVALTILLNEDYFTMTAWVSTWVLFLYFNKILYQILKLKS